MIIPIKRFGEEAKIPRQAKPGDAGRDAWITGFKLPEVDGDKKNLIAIDSDEYQLGPLGRIGCTLGFATAIPEGYYFQVVPRSGLALWEGLTILNTPGTIDCGWRDEWMAIVVNLSNQIITLTKGERICQIILTPMTDYEFEETDELPESARGMNGYGSTGKR
jgi:dUTP pyrophosphatase